MPDWLSTLLSQSPVAAICGFVAYYAYNQLKESHAEQRKRDDRNHTATLTELKQSYEERLKAKDAEIARATGELTRLVGRLEKTIKALTRKLGKREGGS